MSRRLIAWLLGEPLGNEIGMTAILATGLLAALIAGAVCSYCER